MTPTETKHRMCTDKRAYPNEYVAIRACIESSAKFGKPMRYYRCPHCGKFHITSKVGRGHSKVVAVSRVQP